MNRVPTEALGTKGLYKFRPVVKISGLGKNNQNLFENCKNEKQL